MVQAEPRRRPARAAATRRAETIARTRQRAPSSSILPATASSISSSSTAPTPDFSSATTTSGWSPFTPFASQPNIAWDDPNLRFVDLTGDGHADVLITEDDVFSWHPVAGRRRLRPARVPEDGRRTKSLGPKLVFNDTTDTIFLADMSGDGLSDLVRIRNGEICYWPNLGYGRFGRKVTMDDAPVFDAPELFEPRRIRLADIDGSGVVDIIYLAGDGVRLYFNRSGNGWTAPLPPRRLPADRQRREHQRRPICSATARRAWSGRRRCRATRARRCITSI